MAIVPRETNVFVNCPFDLRYQALFDAVVFAIAACGYKVRSALEVADSGDLRLGKIIGLLEQSALSVHDISRMGLDRVTQLPRFNMPIELGIALGMKHLGRKALRDHRLLVVDKERFRYRESASDLAGVDIAAHGDEPRQLIRAVRDFLSSHARRHLPTPGAIEQMYQVLQDDLPGAAAEARQDLGELSYADRLRHISAYLSKAG